MQNWIRSKMIAAAAAAGVLARNLRSQARPGTEQSSMRGGSCTDNSMQEGDNGSAGTFSERGSSYSGGEDLPSSQTNSEQPPVRAVESITEDRGKSVDTAQNSSLLPNGSANFTDDENDNGDDDRLLNTSSPVNPENGGAEGASYKSLEEIMRQSQDSNDDQGRVYPLSAIHFPDMSLHNLQVRSTAPDWNDVIRSVTLALISSGVTGMLAYGLINTALQQDITNISQVSLNQWELVVITFVALCISLVAIRQAFDDCTAPSVQSAPGAPGV